jgi:spermidine synthase
MTQLALMREMLGVFAGSELVLGVVLGNWLLLMGLGAALGRWAGRWGCSAAALAGLLILTAVVPPLQIIALRGLRQFAFLPGEEIGVVSTVAVSFLILLPYCLAAGMFLILACGTLADRGAAAGAGRVYFMDSVGSVIGGALFSFVLVLWFDHAVLLVIPACLNMLAAAWIVWGVRGGGKGFGPPSSPTGEIALEEKPHPEGMDNGGRVGQCSPSAPASANLTVPLEHGALGERCPARTRSRCATSKWLLAAGFAAGTGVLAWICLANPDESSTARQFFGQRLLFRGHSPYGRLIVTELGGQTNVIENGVILAATPNIEQAEETAHFALAQRPGPKRVLLIGGALSGAARQILRHNVTALDCVELDRMVINLGRRFLPGEFSDGRLRFIEADARQFVRQTGAKYDLIVVALPDPTTAQINRFFTHEFFREAYASLRPGGVLSFAVGRYENYASPELSRLLSCARQTAASEFRNVLLIPAGRVYFLASDGPLTTDIAPGLNQAGVKPLWVTENYLAATLSPDRLADLDRATAHRAPLNRDFSPRLYYLHLRHWASQFEGGTVWMPILLAAAAVIYAARLRAEAGVIFASGFAGSALEIVLLLAMQVLAGSVYRQLAWVVTLFMAGLAVGAWVTTRGQEKAPGRAAMSSSRREHTETIEAGTQARSESAALPHKEGAKSEFTRRIQAANLRPESLLCLLAVAVAALALLLPALLPGLARLNAMRGGSLATQGILLLFTFGLAGVVGAQFPLANALANGTGQTASRLYAADFIGASLGALLTSAWLLPLAGASGVCWIAAGLNLAAALALPFRKGPS